MRYRAFGASRFTSGTTPTTFRYTGQREESSFGLYYYGARWYDPGLGRFVQADTIIPNAADARAYDRYAYVLNNPLRYNDPSGHCASVLAAAAGGFSVPVAIVVDSGCLAAAGGAAMATGGAVGVLAVGVYGYVNSTDELPAIPPIQPEVLTDSGFTVTIPVPGSTTVTSGVPLIPGESTTVPGIQQTNDLAPQFLTAVGSQNPKVAEAAEYGKQVHRDWNYGPGYEKEFTLPSGKRPDAINWEQREVVELKPNNANALRRGQRQVDSYRRELEQMTGECWNCRVETYDR